MTLETPADSASQSRGKRESKITTHELSGRNILQGDSRLDFEKQLNQDTGHCKDLCGQ